MSQTGWVRRYGNREYGEVASSLPEPGGAAGAEPPSRKMYPTVDRVLVIQSPRAAALGLRGLVQARDDLDLVAVVADGPAALRVLTNVDAHIVFAPGDVAGMGIVELALRLRADHPERKIGVFVSVEQVDHDLEVALGHIPVDSYLLWDTLNAQSLNACLCAYHADLLLTCKHAAAELFTGPEGRQHARLDALHLRERERAVLHGLADGLSQESIAETEGLPLRTEQQIEGKLRGALNTTTRSELASQARELGFGHRSGRA